MSLKKIKDKGKFLAHSLMWGLKSADKEMLEQKAQNSDPEIQSERQIVQESVFSDFINEEETERVKEYRDKMYRVFKEADKYEVSVAFNGYDRENEVWSSGENGDSGFVSANAIKKEKSFYEKHPLIEENDGEKIILIQDQIIFDLTEKEREREMMGEKVKPQRLITVEYDGYIPNFDITDYFKKIVLKEKEGKKYLDLYFSDAQRHFNYLDAMFLRNLFDKFQNLNYKFDSLDFKEMEFVTTKANGQEDLKKYKFTDPKLMSITHFNGNYVAHYSVNVDIDGKDLSEKYRTKELDEKYKTNAPKSDTINMDLAERLFKVEK